jgi:glycosyltransferase involved in cell wall biosynthesis
VLKEFRPDACLLGNIDFLSRNIVDPILDKKIPIVHHLGNQHPSYTVNETPKSRLYHLATASRWLKNEIKKQKYPIKDISVICPGALVDEFRMRIPPALDKLRIVYVSIVIPYKGPHILINALKKLHVLEIDFFCSIAGTSTDQDFSICSNHLLRKAIWKINMFYWLSYQRGAEEFIRLTQCAGFSLHR